MDRLAGRPRYSVTGLSLALVLSCGMAEGGVFTVDGSATNRERLEERVAYVLSLSDEQATAMVPVAGGGVYFTACPNCNYGAEEAGCFGDTWNPRQPGRLVCKGCGQAYPNNPKYLDDRYLEVEAPGGAKHRLHYYERPTDGYRFWFRAHADYWAREYLEGVARDLGDLYQITRDERYARRVALLLDRFAQVVPGWVRKFDYPFRQKVFAPASQDRIPGTPGDYRTAWRTWWAYMDIPLDLLRAYDGLRDWPGWPSFGDGRGRERIERDLFAPLVEFVLGYPDDGTNMSMTIWRGAILAGRALGRPTWVHEGVRRYEHLLATRFLYDGHWLETADSYAVQTQDGLRVVMDAARGYSDPPGYLDPRDGRRFSDLDLRQLAPDYGVADGAIAAVRLPDGRLLPLNDTWAVHGKTSLWTRDSKPQRERMEPWLLPATGVAVLGGGAGPDQLHAWLNYTMGAHHKHHDALSLGLWANGYELFSDIGYTWTNYRLHWASSTMAHNTVVVDGVDSGLDRLHAGHRLRAYGTDSGGFHLAAAESVTAYPEVTSRYRRTVAVVGADAREAYLIDVFEVTGGQQHDWLLHGCRDADADATVPGADLQPFAGSLLNPDIRFAPPAAINAPNPRGFGFGFVRDLRRAHVGDTATLDLRLAARPEVGTRTLLAGLGGADLFVGRAPDVRRARENNADLEKTTAPVLCVRRRGAALESVFAAVHEPLRGEPVVRGLTALRSGGALFLRVDRGAQGNDWFAMAIEDGAQASIGTPHGSLEFRGGYAWLRLGPGGEVRAAQLCGPELTLGRWRLEGGAEYSGAVRSWDGHGTRAGSRGSLVIDQAVSPAQLGPLLVSFADGTVWPFTVLAVEPAEGGTRLHVRERPAFEVGQGKTRIACYPQREIIGESIRFRLARWVSWAADQRATR